MSSPPLADHPSLLVSFRHRATFSPTPPTTSSSCRLVRSSPSATSPLLSPTHPPPPLPPTPSLPLASFPFCLPSQATTSSLLPTNPASSRARPRRTERGNPVRKGGGRGRSATLPLCPSCILLPSSLTHFVLFVLVRLGAWKLGKAPQRLPLLLGCQTTIWIRNTAFDASRSFARRLSCAVSFAFRYRSTLNCMSFWVEQLRDV